MTDFISFVCLECGKAVKPKKNGETTCSGCGGTDVDVAPATMIRLTYVNSPASRGRKAQYDSLEKARKAAHKLVGPHPKRDPDGYAVDRVTGNCLFFQGVTFEVLFP